VTSQLDAVGCRAEGAHQELPQIRQAHRSPAASPKRVSKGAAHSRGRCRCSGVRSRSVRACFSFGDAAGGPAAAAAGSSISFDDGAAARRGGREFEIE